METENFDWDFENKFEHAKEQSSSVSLYDDNETNENVFQPVQQSPLGSYSIISDFSAKSDIPHVVPCTFTVCLALPNLFGIKGKHTPDISKRFRPEKCTKYRRFYHIEYLLLPDDREPKQVDLVLFNTLVVKVFTESGIKSVRPWSEDNKLWVTWRETHKLSITKEVLKKLNYHKVTFSIWDTKEKVSKRAKFTKIKSLSHQEEFESTDDVKQLVLRQRKLSSENKPRSSTIKTKRGIFEVEPFKPITVEPDGEYKVDPEFEKALKGEEFIQNAKDMGFTVEKQSDSKEASKQWISGSSFIMMDKITTMSRISDKKRRKIKISDKGSDVLMARNESIFTMELDVMLLLTGQKSVMNHTQEKNAKILDCYLDLTVDTPLMSEKQKQDLNPLIIKIKSIAYLPTGPVPLKLLQETCLPVYCKYKFFDSPVHQTQGQPYGTHIYFDDVNVILTGAMDPRNLREYLEGPPMEVEIHDRDKKDNFCLTTPTLFGEELADANLTNMNHITYNTISENLLEVINKKWDPYGIARVSFADLLLGQKCLNLFVPIHRCKPDPSFFQKDNKGHKKSFGGHDPMNTLQSSPMPMGNYLEHSSVLKLRIELCMPLKLSESALRSERFGRIIYIFDSSKVDFLRALLKGITEINAKALHLESYPPHDVQEVLSAFKVKIQVQANLDHDMINGFHLYDGKIHLFILEGLAQQGVKQLWEKYPNHATSTDEDKFQVLYNSELSFHQRLYPDLDALLYHIHLCKPLSSLVKQSMIYIRGLIPQPSFQALLKLDTICHSNKLKDVIKRDLLPSAEMKNLAEASLVRRFHQRPGWRTIRIIPSHGKSIFNYSIQTLNSGELARQQLIAEMDKEKGKNFTYSLDYLASFPEPLGLSIQKPKPRLWLTPEGFQVPGYQSSFESNQHPKKPDSNRIKELKETWQENSLFANILKPVLDRGRMSWEHRHLDFDIYQKPSSMPILPPPAK
ncbi:uncharacterized protein CFAP92 isoform X2 [Macrotis lagotis]|uniref:uncharacterized protein CFAP92 isoform X2 n=1 Tax=Macrotis lagotis TaxID=92651 RepID=UPI003D68A257